MIRSIIDELRHIPLADMGQASHATKATLLVFLILISWMAGERLIFGSKREAIALQQNALSDWDQRIIEVQDQLKQQKELEHAHQATMAQLADAMEAWSVASAWSDWLDWAHEGLSVHDLHGMLQPMPGSRLNDADGDALNFLQHLPLDHHTVSVKASGAWPQLLDWWAQLTHPAASARVVVRAFSLKRGESDDAIELEAKISVLASFATASEPTVLAPMVMASDVEAMPHPFGLGKGHPLAWRQRPLLQFKLTGVGITHEGAWAWLLDPEGQLHTIGLGETLGLDRYRLEEVMPDRVVWRDLQSQQTSQWVMP